MGSLTDARKAAEKKRATRANRSIGQQMGGKPKVKQPVPKAKVDTLSQKNDAKIRQKQTTKPFKPEARNPKAPSAPELQARQTASRPPAPADLQGRQTASRPAAPADLQARQTASRPAITPEAQAHIDVKNSPAEKSARDFINKKNNTSRPSMGQTQNDPLKDTFKRATDKHGAGSADQLKEKMSNKKPSGGFEPNKSNTRGKVGKAWNTVKNIAKGAVRGAGRTVKAAKTPQGAIGGALAGAAWGGVDETLNAFTGTGIVGNTMDAVDAVRGYDPEAPASKEDMAAHKLKREAGVKVNPSIGETDTPSAPAGDNPYANAGAGNKQNYADFTAAPNVAPAAGGSQNAAFAGSVAKNPMRGNFASRPRGVGIEASGTNTTDQDLAEIRGGQLQGITGSDGQFVGIGAGQGNPNKGRFNATFATAADAQAETERRVRAGNLTSALNQDVRDLQGISKGRNAIGAKVYGDGNNASRLLNKGGLSTSDQIKIRGQDQRTGTTLKGQAEAQGRHQDTLNRQATKDFTAATQDYANSDGDAKILKGQQLLSGFDASTALDGTGGARQKHQTDFVLNQFLTKMQPGLLDFMNQKLDLGSSDPQAIFEQVQADPGLWFESAEFEVNAEGGTTFGGQDTEMSTGDPALDAAFRDMVEEANKRKKG